MSTETFVFPQFPFVHRYQIIRCFKEQNLRPDAILAHYIAPHDKWGGREEKTCSSEHWPRSRTWLRAFSVELEVAAKVGARSTARYAVANVSYNASDTKRKAANTNGLRPRRGALLSLLLSSMMKRLTCVRIWDIEATTEHLGCERKQHA